MSDQQAPQNGDTPAVAGPEQAPGTAQEQAEVNWEKRYQDLQPEYTRTSQEAAQLREQLQYYEDALTSEDPDTRRQALEALGYEIPDEIEDVEPAEYDDPYDELRAEVSSVRERQEQAEQQARFEAEHEILTDYVHDQFEQLGIDDDATQLWILERAKSLPVRPPAGMPVQAVPDVKAAYEEFQQWELSRQKQWARTKQAPYVSPGGQPANEVPNLDASSEQRVAYALQKLQERDMTS